MAVADRVIVMGYFYKNISARNVRDLPNAYTYMTIIEQKYKQILYNRYRYLEILQALIDRQQSSVLS
jgi:hypothetical protein